MSVVLTSGQAGDNPQLLPLLDQVAIGCDGPGSAAQSDSAGDGVRPKFP